MRNADVSKPQDLRVRKTVAAIEGAFLQLLRANDFDKVTVSMICAQALVNKGTFYRHFADKYDLADQVKRDMVGRFRQTLVDLQQATGDDQGEVVVSHLLTAAEDNLEDLTRLRWIRSGVNLEVEMWQVAYQLLTTQTHWKDKDAHEAASVAWVILYLALGYPEYRRQVSEPLDLYHYFLMANEASDLYALEQA